MKRLNIYFKLNCIPLKKWIVFICASSLSLCFSHIASAGDPYQSPLFLANSVKPIMMLNMSKDHQLFFKLYDDYSDITGGTNGAPDGAPDTTYINDYTYYGYFDSDKCYTYSITSKRFVPANYTDDHYCNKSPVEGQWSGNFLNWASMTRIDAIRKMLYGGYRSTDSTGSTVLERALLPNDAHSFAKYYSASDTNKLTPFSNNSGASDIKNRGITICNTTSVASRSLATTDNLDTSTSPPVLRVVRGNYSLWASHGGFECVWSDEGDSGSTITDNGNNQTMSGIAAYSNQPPATAVLGPAGGSKSEYVARVEVCSNSALIQAPSGLPNNNRENCLGYGSSYKPIGLLQRYASAINFALMTGSYNKNKSGGVLRKPVSSITNEIDANGNFIVPSDGYSIIQTLNALRIYGYNYKDGYYFKSDDTSFDNCAWGLYSFDDGRCSNWGNPQAEIYLESLRYLAGKSSAKFGLSETEKLSTLKSLSSWIDPITQGNEGNYCAPLNILQFNSSTTSYDNDQLTSSFNDLFGASAITEATNQIGASENIHNNSYYVGKAGTANNQLCTAKTVTSLSGVEGICPYAPRLGGGYNLAGLAYLARSTGIGTNREKVKTFGVALAPALPQITVTAPGGQNKKITIMPACRADEGSADKQGNCSIVDFKVVGHTVTNSLVSGKLYVNWEDSEQGGDYDQDMWGVIQYSISSTEVTISSKVAAQSAWPPMGFGYIIGGTKDDGFHVQSGTNYFIYGDMCTSASPCTCLDEDDTSNNTDAWQGNCDSSFNTWRSKKFEIGSSTPQFLKEPLYYAAKWGGYTTTSSTTTLNPTQIAATTPETYFFASDAKKLEESLEKAFREAAGTVASSATVAANTTRIDTTTMAYQARFDSGTWSGQVVAYPFTTDGTVSNTPTWNTDTTVTFSNHGPVYTYPGATELQAIQVDADSPSNTPTLFAALKQTGETDAHAQNRMRWLLGSHPSGLRVRTKYMGDIVNADPAYAGPSSQRYQALPMQYGSTLYRAYVQSKSLTTRKRALFVGANDGKLHALNAETGAELFSYIPRGVYSRLIGLTNTNYTHQFTVDGPLYVGDFYEDADADGLGGTWRTIVVGGLGAGGKGIYALDITDALASNGSPKVIFDYSADDSATPASIKNDLGYIMSRPLVVPTMNGNWSVVFANGVNSFNGISKLIAIDVEDPSSIKVINTDAKFTTGNDNGLTAVALLPDGNGVTNYAYGGDLLGNMWKFDLTSTSMNSWGVAYGTNNSPKPLITVRNSADVVQPITAAPTLGYNSVKTVGSGSNAKDSVMVYFGTGKYYELTDGSNTTQNTLYAIADTGSALSMTKQRTGYYKKEISSSSTSTKRTISFDTGTSWWANNNGWYLDFPASGGGGTGTERVITKPLLIYDRLILNTFIPAAYQCGYGGSSWLMELRAVGDKYEDHTILGENANGLLDMPVLGDMIPLMTGEKITLLGSPMGDKENPPTLLTVEGTLPGGTRGRMSWRQLK